MLYYSYTVQQASYSHSDTEYDTDHYFKPIITHLMSLMPCVQCTRYIWMQCSISIASELVQKFRSKNWQWNVQELSRMRGQSNYEIDIISVHIIQWNITAERNLISQIIRTTYEYLMVHNAEFYKKCHGIPYAILSISVDSWLFCQIFGDNSLAGAWVKIRVRLVCMTPHHTIRFKQYLLCMITLNPLGRTSNFECICFELLSKFHQLIEW